MFKGIGFSVYLSNYEQIRERLSSLCEEGCHIFTSFHIGEERDASYPDRMGRMCRELKEMGFLLAGDVSGRTPEMFGCASLSEVVERYGLSAVRMDYGVSEEETLEIGRRVPVCMNASTLRAGEAKRLAGKVKELYAIHNFYPRPETGLDEALFTRINEDLRKIGIKTAAFLPGDCYYRGPLCQGLPTLELHRGGKPYASYVDLKKRFHVDGVFVGDGIVSQEQADRIRAFDGDGVVRIPVTLTPEAKRLYGSSFTIRADSPSLLKRFEESREYSRFGERIEPSGCTERTAGCLTMDNIKYLRYSGEVQLILEDLPADERVNVIGHVQKGYELLLRNIENADRIMLCPPIPEGE